MTFPKTHSDGEAWDGAAVTDLEQRIHDAIPGFVGKGSSGVRIAGLGDSITAHHRAEAPGQPTYISGQGWLFWAMLASGGRLRYHGVYATGGLTAAQVLATDIPLLQAAPIKPDIVTILVGVNDLLALATTASSLATSFTAVRALISAVRALGIQPVLCTIPGMPAATPIGLPITRWNSWIRREADLQGLALLDFQTVVGDPAAGAGAGNFLAGYSEGDNIHPSSLGAQAMGSYIAAQFGTGSLPFTPPLALFDADGVNLVTNPLNATNAAPGPYPDGWSDAALGGTAAHSLVVDAAIIGKWWRINKTVGAGSVQYYQLLSAATGTRVRLSGRLKINSMSASAALRINCFGNGSNPVLVDEDGMGWGRFWIDTGPGAGQQIGAASGPFQSRETVMPSAAAGQFYLTVQVDGVADVQLAQLCAEVFNADGTI